jgi:hypothetical protein
MQRPRREKLDFMRAVAKEDRAPSSQSPMTRSFDKMP